MAEFEELIIKEFLSEANELVEDAEQAFLALEANPQDQAIIDRIFRVAHTIKGSAYTVGLNALGAFAHEFESLLDSIRKKELVATQLHIDIMLAANDMVRRTIQNDLGVSSMPPGVETLVDRIRDSFQQRKKAPAEGKAKLNVVPNANDLEVAPAPEAKSDVETALPDQSKMEDHLGKGAILVVDDELDMLSLLSDEVSSHKRRVLTADSGKKALEILSSQNVDLVVTDLQMPEMNGQVFIENAMANHPNLQVIFMSGYAKREDVINFMRMGAFDFLEKPLNFDHLHISISNALKMKVVQDGAWLLSLLHHRMYIGQLKIMGQLPTRGESQEDLRNRLDSYLEKISSLSEFIRTSKQSAPTR